MPADQLDADAQRVCEMIVASGRPPIETLTPVAARAVYLASKPILQPDPEPVAEVLELEADGPAGPIPLRLYRARPAAEAAAEPVLVYFHGGGWVIGDLESHDQVCRAVANAVPCTVVAVDYRLAPEHKFPAAVEDAIAATRYVWRAADALKVDATRLAVAGDSAGGNLAAVVSLDARDRGGPVPLLQWLIYPGTDMAMDTASIARHAEQLPLTKKAMQWFVAHYLRQPSDAGDWRASPLRAPSLRGLPPALIVTAGFDPLCDEGEAYARALAADNVPVTLRRFEGQIHGFLTMGRIVADSRRAIEMGAAALAEAFGLKR
ncbi:MAG TPA: alpha/beta hydrolase [Hyphomicrobiaceae bacterium]|nr:alpha/beta hydrolase [Hyphomicrobiaceae bacterium]